MKVFHVAVIAIAIGYALPAQAQVRCRVTDPSPTPLNVRTGPYGQIVGTVSNGRLVSIVEQTRDRRGALWAYIRDAYTAEPIGWVYREFISCY